MRDYRTVLRAKGIKPLARAVHTIKRDGDLELLPVAGIYRHVVESDNVVALISRDLRSAVIL